MRAQKFVMPVLRNAKNMTWIIANVAQKRAGGALKNAGPWHNNRHKQLDFISCLCCPDMN